MKRKFQKGNPDLFDLVWLDDEELHKLQEAMQSNRENHILIFRAIGIDFKATGKPTSQGFCEMLVQCCEGALLRSVYELN
jgi:hypothetical protein